MTLQQENAKLLPFRRRCAWCGVALRGWQLNLCRRCKERVLLPYADAWCGEGSRWDAAPDAPRFAGGRAT